MRCGCEADSGVSVKTSIASPLGFADLRALLRVQTKSGQFKPTHLCQTGRMIRSVWFIVTLLALVACVDRKPPVPEPVASRGEPAEFIGMLAAHNRWRAEVGTPPLIWSDAAARLPQSWADQLAGEGCELRHNPGVIASGAWGENIFGMERGGDYEGYRRNAVQVVDNWASERQWYDADNHRCSAPAGQTCGHFTQVVSTLSSHVGCGRARCERAEVWVCNYAPPGNFVGSAPF